MKSEIFYPVPNPRPVYRPLFTCLVPAGFPSPAEDYIDRRLDLHDLLQTERPSVFYVRLSGNSMINAGMHPGDYLVVDRATLPANGKIVVANIDGDLTVKRLHYRFGKVELHPANPEFKVMTLDGDHELSIFGVVTGIVRLL